jgi:hypothetical protein
MTHFKRKNRLPRSGLKHIEGITLFQQIQKYKWVKELNILQAFYKTICCLSETKERIFSFSPSTSQQDYPKIIAVIAIHSSPQCTSAVNHFLRN